MNDKLITYGATGGLDSLGSLSNPHFRLAGDDVGTTFAHVIAQYKNQVDFLVVSRRNSALYHAYGRNGEDAKDLSLPYRVLDMPEGLAVAIAACREELKKNPELLAPAADSVLEDPFERLLKSVDDQVLSHSWGTTVVDGQRYLIEAAPSNIDGANEYLNMLDLPPLHEEEDGSWTVCLRAPGEGRGLLTHGVRPIINEEAKHQDLLVRGYALRKQYPKADSEAIREFAENEQEGRDWEWATIVPTLTETNRIDHHGTALADVLEDNAYFHPFKITVERLCAGTRPFGGFAPGAIRFLDLEDCDTYRRAVILLSTIYASQAGSTMGRWRCLIVDDQVFSSSDFGFKPLEYLLRQGRKTGLSVVLVDNNQNRFPSDILAVVGNVIKSGNSPEEVDLPSPEARKRVEEIASKLRSVLQSSWVVSVDESRGPITANHIFRELRIGEIYLSEEEFLWRQNDTSTWKSVPTDDTQKITTNRFGLFEKRFIDSEAWVIVVERARGLLEQLFQERRHYPRANYWWYPVAHGHSIPLTAWR